MTVDLGFPIPKTEAALFDLMAERFGIGAYDDVARSDVPYYMVRMREISKLKAMMRKRRLTVREVAIAIWYCQRAGVPITESWQVIQQMNEAVKAYRAAEKSIKSAEHPNELEQVVQEMVEAGQHELAAQLVRANKKSQRALIHEWRSANG